MKNIKKEQLKKEIAGTIGLTQHSEKIQQQPMKDNDLEIMREFGYPVVYDATHSVQLPGGKGISSGGERRFIPGLSRAAVSMGCDGLFLEVHKDPDKAPCDGPNMLTLDMLKRVLRDVKEIDALVRR